MVLKIMRTWKDIIDKYLEQSQDISEIETNGTTSLFIKDKGKRVELQDSLKMKWITLRKQKN